MRKVGRIFRKCAVRRGLFAGEAARGICVQHGASRLPGETPNEMRCVPDRGRRLRCEDAHFGTILPFRVHLGLFLPKLHIAMKICRAHPGCGGGWGRDCPRPAPCHEGRAAPCHEGPRPRPRHATRAAPAPGTMPRRPAPAPCHEGPRPRSAAIARARARAGTMPQRRAPQRALLRGPFCMCRICRPTRPPDQAVRPGRPTRPPYSSLAAGPVET